MGEGELSPVLEGILRFHQCLAEGAWWVRKMESDLTLQRFNVERLHLIRITQTMSIYGGSELPEPVVPEKAWVWANAATETGEPEGL